MPCTPCNGILRGQKRHLVGWVEARYPTPSTCGCWVFILQPNLQMYRCSLFVDALMRCQRVFILQPNLQMYRCSLFVDALMRCQRVFILQPNLQMYCCSLMRWCVDALLSAPALQHQAHRTIFVLLAFGNLEALFGRFRCHRLQSILLGNAIQEKVYRPGLSPVL